ncbi:MAG: SDR family oxidoreductase [Deltaproteobacteria bacterium]|nr:SDR family oxidoreductase [Deltaproteobacteria bacterium]
MSEIAGRRVLITGAASGLGLLLAQKLARRGAHVVLWDVNAAGLEAARRDIEAAGRSVETDVCDVSSREAIEAAAGRALARAPIDVLINNAGVVTGKTLLDATPREIELTFDVNVLALFWMTRAFLPTMLARNSGHIVTIASAAGIVGISKMTDYCASKHAAVGFDESLRLELRRLGSRVVTTVVCPFYISTGMFAGVRTRFPAILPILDPERVTDRIVDAIVRNKRRLILPGVVRTTWLGRLLPIGAFDAIMEFLGVNHSMDHFTGRAAH